jgi:5-methylcytosine-specific restriction protein A
VDIKTAQQQVLDRLITPALAQLPPQYRHTLIHIRTLIERCPRVGDLCRYLEQLSDRQGEPDGLSEALSAHKLPTLAALSAALNEAAGSARDERSTVRQLVVGQHYSAYVLAIIAGTYNIQPGIHLVKSGQTIEAILLKATLTDGKYANQWLVPGETLKYYFYGPDGVYSRDHAFNRAIIESGTRPILVFIKHAANDYELIGRFRYESDHEDPDGARWSTLTRLPFASGADPAGAVVTEELLEAELQQKLARSRITAPDQRAARLAIASPTPDRVVVQGIRYVRNADVISAVLERAAGHCERCHHPAPFRRPDGSPYLEVHHKIRLADNGPDTVANALALCPNCHRELHYGLAPATGA